MKKIFFTLLMALTTVVGKSQTISETIYIYRNDGEFNAFFREEVDSITYSYYDADSLLYDEIVTQLVYTEDSLYRIPLANIDSISFVTPETKYTSQVVKMEPLLPYITEVDGMTLTISKDIPLNLIPQKDDILVLDNFGYEQFPTGFAGRMTSNSGLKIICDSVSFEDIYEQILCYGRYTATDDTLSENDKVQFAARRRVDGIISSYVTINGKLGNPDTGPYATLDGRAGLDLRFTFKYNRGEPVYFDISLIPEFSLNFETGIKSSWSKSIESMIPLLLIPIPNTPFYFKVNGGPIFEAAVKASVVAKTDAKLGYKFGVKYENGSFKGYGSNTSKWFSKPDITGSIDGNVLLGLKLESGIYSYGDIVKLVIEKKLGPEIKASISENIKNPNNYNDLCNDYLDLNLMASATFKAEAKFFKWLKFSARCNIYSGKVNILQYKIVPTFTKPSVSTNMNSAAVSVIPKDNLLFPVSIGLGLWDNQNNILDTHFCEDTYRNKDSWSLNEYSTLFMDLTPNTEYTVRPLVKLFDGIIIASPEEPFKITTYPITLDVHDIQETSAEVYGRIEGFENLDKSARYGIGYTTKEEVGSTLFDAMDYYGGGLFSVTLMALKPNTLYKCFAYVIVDEKMYYGEVIEFTTKGSLCPDEKHPHAIDLGLPSGTKWACCNVGADAPEECGGYYAWGETSTKSVYEINNCMYYKQKAEGIWGWLDIGSDIAGTSYDAAIANWGGSWRMPTKSQIDELVNYTTSEWTKLNGVGGRKISGPNGCSIFIPASGYRYGDKLEYYGLIGSCWSSTLEKSESNSLAYSLTFAGGGLAKWDHEPRESGLSVRPVR